MHGKREVTLQLHYLLQQQDGLLGNDELSRFFPSGKITLLILTWNMNSKQAPRELNDLLLPEQLLYLPDMYAIGIQEGVSSSNSDVKELEVTKRLITIAS